uniref:BGAL3 n=1 Tax=Arundo donax TaxID=35708 RepID=A0A0A9FH46_ARUDO
MPWSHQNTCHRSWLFLVSYLCYACEVPPLQMFSKFQTVVLVTYHTILCQTGFEIYLDLGYSSTSFCLVES